MLEPFIPVQLNIQQQKKGNKYPKSDLCILSMLGVVFANIKLTYKRSRCKLFRDDKWVKPFAKNFTESSFNSLWSI